MLDRVFNESWYGKQALAIIKPKSDNFFIYDVAVVDSFGTLKLKGAEFRENLKVKGNYVAVKNSTVTVHIPQPRIEVADTVFHRPTGEVWVVGKANSVELVPCGYPVVFAKVSDCVLIEKATREEVEKLKVELSKLPMDDIRRI